MGTGVTSSTALEVPDSLSVALGGSDMRPSVMGTATPPPQLPAGSSVHCVQFPLFLKEKLEVLSFMRAFWLFLLVANSFFLTV